MKTPTFLWGFFLADFNYKIGEKLRFLTKMCPPVVIQVGGQTRVDLATLAFFPCFVGFFGPVNDVDLIKTL